MVFRALLLAAAVGASYEARPQPPLPPEAQQIIKDSQREGKQYGKGRKPDCKTGCAQALESCESMCTSRHVKDCNKNCSKVTEPCLKKCRQDEKTQPSHGH
jgi:hypothetical protein